MPSLVPIHRALGRAGDRRIHSPSSRSTVIERQSSTRTMGKPYDCSCSKQGMRLVTGMVKTCDITARRIHLAVSF
eukprot:scaffold2879_cov269-Prasinococcus_capsulatus_cf.AAC.39